jgi:hypothetical protein
MKIEKAHALFDKLESDQTIQNFVSQGDSKYILYNVNEPVDNFPSYTSNIDDRLNNIAFSYLSVGCCFAECNCFQKSAEALTKGAAILEYVHKPEQNRSTISIYYLLISSLAYYASFNYSKSFILLKDVEFNSDGAKIIGSFLKKNLHDLIALLNSVLLNDDYSDRSISMLTDEKLADGKIHTFILAKSFSTLIEFIYSGDKKWIDSTISYLNDLKELAAIESEPSLWWIARILKILINGFFKASLWSVLPPLLGNNYSLINRFILGLVFMKPPIIELFISQRKALEMTINDTGAVVSLPTSSGKTRIAEITILGCILNDPDSLILYLAPFRSLAYEIEETLYKSFKSIGCEMSHLYGGGQFSKIDKELIKESRIIIATPEKAKAILRADSEITSRIKLVIIDEGHLLGAEKRLIQNEIFIEELRYHIEKNFGKIVVLSAVLPNTEEISKWITKNEENSVRLNWRPSSQRFGIIEWTGNNVNIEWTGGYKSYNKNFVEKFKPKGKTKYFPSNKKQAIAAATVKLSQIGSVLIFVGRANMVKSQAKEVSTALGSEDEMHQWKNKEDWTLFKLACEEYSGRILKYIIMRNTG